MTVITYSRLGDTAVVNTTDTTVRKKLSRMADKHPDEYVITDASEDSFTAELPKMRIRFAHSAARANYSGDK